MTTPLSCPSCRYSIHMANGGGLWCVRNKRRAAARCPLFVYEPGTDEHDSDDNQGEPR